MKHLENFTIHQFRGLKNVTLSNLGQINLLVGVNNSGKTTILEAISTYCRPLDPLEWLNTARRREIKSSRYSMIDSLMWLFPQKPKLTLADTYYQGEIYTSANGKFSVRELRAFCKEFEGLFQFSKTDLNEEDDENTEESNFDTNDFYSRRGVELQIKVEIFNSEMTLLEDFQSSSLEENFIFWQNERFVTKKNRGMLGIPVDTITPVSHRIEQLQVSLLSEATLERFKSEVISLLQEMDSGIRNLEIISFSGNRSSIHIDHEQLGFPPLSAFGDGVRRLLFMALTLAKVRGGVLLIDEIETSIHTEALEKSFAWLVHWCQKLDVQLFATTHSLEVIDKLLAATNPKTDLVLYRLQKEDSETKAIRIDRETLSIVREELGMEVRG